MTDTAVEVYAEPAGSDMEQWARDLQQAYGMAVRLVTTSFVPESYKGKPEEAAAAMMVGAELGLSPLASLRSIDIIHGVPGMRALTLRALVQSKGHEVWTEEQTATRAIVKGRRKGSDKVETSTFTIERAEKLGLTSKDNWRKQPMNMLLARATSECARLIAADVLLGIPYSTEELEDLGEVEAAPAGAAAASKRSNTRAKRAPLDPNRGEAPEPDGAADDPMRAGDRAAIEAAVQGAPEDAVDAIGGEAMVAQEEANARARNAADREFSDRPVMDEPAVDWAPPAATEEQ